MAFRGPGAEPPGDPAAGGIPPGTGDPKQREAARQSMFDAFVWFSQIDGLSLQP